MRFTRETYQGGCLTREPRAKGDVWAFRWREAGPSGKPVHRKIIVGTARELSKAAAHKEVEAMNLQINTNQPRRGPITVAELIAHYRAAELGPGRKSKTPNTCRVYEFNLRNHIEPRWGERGASSIAAPEIEAWLGSLPHANGTKAKFRNIMSAVWNHGIRHQLLSVNPIIGTVKGSGVRQSAKRCRTPDVLTFDEERRLLAELKDPYRTMVLVLALLGLRFSELRGLQWGDLDDKALKLNLVRGVVEGDVGEMKTLASRRPSPITEELCATLQKLRSASPYSGRTDWVFASVKAAGRVPIWPSSALADHIRPAVERAGINKKVTWHVLRHSFATQMKANGEDVKVVQDSLRHATARISVETYMQSVPDDVRRAHEQIASAIMVECVPGCSQIEPTTLLGGL